MDAEEITVGMNVVISILFGAFGATGAWFALKGSVNLLKQRVKVLEEDEKIMHSRINSLKEEVKENRQNSESSISKLTKEMHEMEKRILSAIHDIKK